MGEEMKKILDANKIKFIAIIAMTIDHLTWAFFPGLQTVWYVMLLHIIGHLTAPIMWFFIAEGCHYTKDARKYIGRLFLFALIVSVYWFNLDTKMVKALEKDNM